MKTRMLLNLACGLAAGCILAGAHAGTFKHINIDGDFGDWAGVPLAYTQAQDVTNAVAYKDIYVANDEDYLYIRFSIYAADNPFTAMQNIFINTDASTATGFQAGGGGRVGWELLVQGGVGYQEKNGGFNEGDVNGLDWQAAPAAPATDFEVRLSRHATYASDGTAVFTSDAIAFVLEAEINWVSVEWAPSSGGLSYTFEPAPSALTTNLTLVDLTTASWQANAAGTDLGTAWLDPAYDDTQAGWTSGTGLFGYTGTPGVYPPIHTALASGPNAYYFRTHFQWNFLTANVAFVVTNYLSDGAAYYLNGVEVRRVRLPGGTLGFATPATGANPVPGQAQVFGLPGGPLLIGDNLLEVETHQAPGTSADMVLGLSLEAAVAFPVLLADAAVPADRTVVAGNPTTFTADFVGSGPLAYQWLKDGTEISGATNAAYSIPIVLGTDAGGYALRVSNPLSTNTTRSAVLLVNTAPVLLADLTQPADVAAVEGRPAAFAAAAGGSPPLQYQWFKDGTALLNQTNATLALPAVLAADAGSYFAQISNPVSSTNSRAALLTVLRDTIPPAVIRVIATATQVAVVFSEPVDTVSAGNPANYNLSGGLTVVSATPGPSEPALVTLAASAPLGLGVNTLTIAGVKDLFGNSSATTVPFVRGIVVDGDMSDWAGMAPLYSGPSGSDGAADFKDIYVYNDADFYYFRVTLWHDIDPAAGQFPSYVNMFFDTDNNPDTGYLPSSVGSELLVQSGFSYAEKNGTFNDGTGIAGLSWLCLPAAPGTNFEFQLARSATFADTGLPVFGTNVLNFSFQGMNPSFVPLNQAPQTGTLSYTNTEPPRLPLGRLSAQGLSGRKVAVVWDTPGTLQAGGSLTSSGAWTNVPAAASPYVTPVAGQQLYYRLAR